MSSNNCTNSKISGRCLCGSIEYTSEAEPIKTSVCHCESCQRQTGSAFSVLVIVPEDSIVFTNTDTLREYKSIGDSGGDVRRKFCKNCGSPVLSTVDVVPGLAFIKAGTLNDKSWLKPSSHIWCSTAQPWVQIAQDLETHKRNPT